MNTRHISFAMLSVFCACVFMTPLLAFGQKPPTLREIVVFGDSLSDSGNVYIASGFSFPPDPPYYMGRFTNGPTWVEYMAANLGLPSPAPSLFGGTNFAWGGSETGNGFSLNGTPNLGLQLDFYLASNKPPRDDQLFVVWSGANDLTNPFVAPDPTIVVANIAAHITGLANASARYFLIPDMPSLGQTPLVVGTPDEAYLDQLSIEYNRQLAIALRSLESNLDIKVIRVPVFFTFALVRTFPHRFGLENVTGTAKLDPTDFFDPEVVDNPEVYLFFDYEHPTTVGHEIIGELASFQVRTSNVFLNSGKGAVGKGAKP